MKEKLSVLDILQDTYPGSRLRYLLKKEQNSYLLFLKDAADIPAGPVPYHTGSVLDHMARCMDAVAGDSLAVWMALAHDAGKLTGPKSLWPHHYGHEKRGEQLVTVWARQLELPEAWLQAGCMMARLHMKAGRYETLKAVTRYKLLNEVFTSPFSHAFWGVADADSCKNISYRAQEDWKKIQAMSTTGLSPEQSYQSYLRCLID